MDIWLKVFIAFVVIQNAQTQSRPVVNTTCLDLAKQSNQQYRLICSHDDYHCLLDESYTQEFEVCREWKWIPGGKCAYFNTYGSGNVDERQCKPGISLTCSERNRQFESNKNIQFTACYAKRNSSTSLTTSTSPALVTPNNVTSNGDNAKSSVTSNAWIISLFTVIAVFLSIAAIFIIRRYMDKSLCKKGNSDANEPADMNESDSLSEDFEDAHSSPISNKQINSVVTTAYHVECQKSMDLAMNKDTSEKDPFLGNKTEDTSEKSPIMRQQYDTITGARKSENTDEGQKEKSAKTASGSGFDSVTSDNEEDKDKKESNCVFDDTFESLERKTPQTDAKGHEKLYNLLHDGTLTPKVMTAVITKITEKTVEELLNDENVQNKLENILDIGTKHIPHTEKGDASIHVLYALLRIHLDEKHHPKSGWGNPVKDKDIGIGDDIDRLYRIFTITEKIPRYNIVSVENYNRLLDIMIKTCTRLDSHVDGQCNEDIKAFTSECRSTSLTEKMNNIKEYFSTYLYGND